MTARLDTVVTAIVIILMSMAAAHLIADHVFEPVPLASAITSLLAVRVAHHHAPRYIAAKWGRKK